jgi:predicted TPR repeat methyltransferase
MKTTDAAGNRPDGSRRKGSSRRKPRGADKDETEFSERLKAAVAAHQGGKLDEAEATYRAVLAECPRQADALQLLGVLRHMRGDRVTAIKLLRQALRIAPDNAAAHDNLARVLRESGKAEAALPHHRVALGLDSSRAEPFANLATTLDALGRLDDAVEALAQASSRAPQNGNLHYYRARLLTRLDRFEDATAAYASAIENGAKQANVELGNLLVAVDDREGALAVLRRWAVAAPDDPVARHLIAAFSGDAAPRRASDGYVRLMFDRFAPRFEAKLDKLGYRVPALLSTLIAHRLESNRADLDVADLGCGTGLCGSFLRPYAGRLVGIDLSPNMLAQARERGHYDELIDRELTSYLRAHPASFDVAVAGDVLCYFGELGEVVGAAFQALRREGFFAFTLEAASDSRHAYILHHNGRYAHSEDYVRHALETAGFIAMSVQRDTLRRERDELVSGFIIGAARP